MAYRKNDTPLEDDECKAFHKWLEAEGIPHAHIANESRSGGRSPADRRNAVIRGARLKAMGQSAGYWDYDIYLPITGISGEVDCYQLVKIEMKRQKGGTVSAEQKKWGEIYEASGIPCAVCKGAEAAKTQVLAWLEEIAQ